MSIRRELVIKGQKFSVNVTACDEFPGLKGLEYGELDMTTVEFTGLSGHVHTCERCWHSREIHLILSEIHALHADVMRANDTISANLTLSWQTKEACRTLMLCETSIQRITHELVRAMNLIHR